MTKTISEQLVEQTMQELRAAEKPQAQSRTWTDPEGYRYLIQWSNAVLLRFFVRKFTESLPKSEYRRKSQVDDAARSVVRNIEEGYKRATTAEYIQFISYSQGSLEEVKGDVRELTEDKFLPSKPGSNLAGIGIDLGKLNQSLRIKEPLTSSNNPLGSFKGDYRKLKDFSYRSITVLYPPLDNVQAQDLTYEIFIELINKTDWVLRKLVESLETKTRVDKEKAWGY